MDSIQRINKMERKSNAGTAFVMLFLIVVVVFGYHFATKSYSQGQLPPAIPTLFSQEPAEQLAYVPPTSIMQSTVDAFYAAPADSTPVPTLEIPVPTVPSIQLTTCIDSPIFSKTNYGQEYIIGMAAKGLTFDVAERSSDSQWVKLAQGNETYEFWIPSAAFCFAP
jgi:hypothetical protein